MHILRSVLVLMALSLSLIAYGQIPDKASLKNLVPKTPEAAAFDNYINMPVSLATGIPDISVPIYTNAIAKPHSNDNMNTNKPNTDNTRVRKQTKLDII